MASVIKLNLEKFKSDMEGITAILENTELWLRPVVAELSGEMAYRIHEKGLASDGSKIGSYDSTYLKRREKNKLGTDPNVILVYTRKLSNSWGVFPTEKGWGVGFVDDGGNASANVSESGSEKKTEKQTKKTTEKKTTKATVKTSAKKSVKATVKTSEKKSTKESTKGGGKKGAKKGSPKNITSLLKVVFAESHFKKKIKELTESENAMVNERINEIINNLINNLS